MESQTTPRRRKTESRKIRWDTMALQKRFQNASQKPPRY